MLPCLALLAAIEVKVHDDDVQGGRPRSLEFRLGYVTGHITKVHKRDFELLGHVRRASEDEPQYEVKSDKTDHVAAHKATAMKHVR